jgi:hypothetical protein
MIKIKKKPGRPKIYTDDVKLLLPVWLDQGEALESIAKRIGTTTIALQRYCWSNQISLNKKRDRWIVRLPTDVVDKLRERAAERRVTPTELVTQLVQIILVDDLFEALLDG